MSLNSIIRGGVKLIDKAFKSMEDNVQHSFWRGQADAFGTPDLGAPYASPTSRKVIIILSQEELRVGNKTVRTFAHLIFLQPFTGPAISDRTGPIDTRDTIILPNGKTGPIVKVDGVWDSETKTTYFAEVWLGDKAV